MYYYTWRHVNFSTTSNSSFLLLFLHTRLNRERGADTRKDKSRYTIRAGASEESFTHSIVILPPARKERKKRKGPTTLHPIIQNTKNLVFQTAILTPLPSTTFAPHPLHLGLSSFNPVLVII